MGRCVIFCAGGFEKLALPIEEDDYILAADGGLAHLQKLGLAPDGILGDFDSLGYVPENAQVFPVEKDDTDAMLAVRKVSSWDMGNLSSMAPWTVRGWTTPSPICRPCCFWKARGQRARWWD